MPGLASEFVGLTVRHETLVTVRYADCMTIKSSLWAPVVQAVLDTKSVKEFSLMRARQAIASANKVVV